MGFGPFVNRQSKIVNPMIISHNEIVVACLKAFEALELPLGQREDAAEAIGWLALHGLPFEDQLATALHSFQPKSVFANPISQSGQESVWDAQGGSALHIFPNLADYAAAQARVHNSHTLSVRNLTDFGVMWPYITKIQQRQQWVKLIWKNGADADMVAVGLPDSPLPKVSWLMGDGAERDVQLIVAQPGFGLGEDDNEIGQIIRVDSGSGLAQNASDRFKSGILINPSLWQQLKQIGLGILVEATAESEQRGAGGV